jgi:hypothetical protein
MTLDEEPIARLYPMKMAGVQSRDQERVL